MKDTWAQPKGDSIERGRRRWLGLGGVLGDGEWGQLFLNNKKEKNPIIFIAFGTPNNKYAQMKIKL